MYVMISCEKRKVSGAKGFFFSKYKLVNRTEYIEILEYMCVWVDLAYMYILLWAACDTMSIFKHSTTDLNSVFLLLDWLPYQEPNMLYYLPMAVVLMEERTEIHTFPKSIIMKWSTNRLIQDLNSGHQLHFLWW